ncbi:MAG: BACON domain-containing protein [Bacteroidales bacterium]|nr:BACON domain-containing protein [Bacteroidales bacterium]
MNFRTITAGLLLTAALITNCDKKDDPATLNIENAPQTAVAATGGTATFDVKSNTDWSVSKPADATWLTIAPQSGSGNAQVTLTLAANEGASRTAALNVSGGSLWKTVNISQAAAEGKDPAPQTLDLGDGTAAYEIKQNTTLSYPNTYNLKGFVYVVDGVTLTIEPGVIVKGDKGTKATLIVERGGKIMAQGTAERPIVFTSAQAAGSRKPGDWGGIILLGKAPNNMGEQTIEGGVRSKHGGTDPADNSGTLSYVRIEFAGIEYATDNEINGITLGSTGSGTTLDHIQVSHSGDDSYEWFGGTVNARYLVAYGTWDDDFDTDNGFSGRVQYALAVRNPQTADKSASNSFESDNNAAGSATEPYTSVVFANMSLFGPVANPASYTDQGGQAGSTTDARFQAALHLRRNTQLSIFNSLIAAFPVGLIVENDKGSTTQTWATDGKLNVTNCVMAGMMDNYQDAQYWSAGSVFNTAEGSGAFAESYFTREGGGNRVFNALADLKLSGTASPAAPVVFPATDSPLATGAAWTDAKVSSGFDKVNYIGAFAPTETASSNWTTGWTNFDPQNTAY